MLEFLKSTDTELFLFLNGKHNEFFDFIMYWASDRFIWIPFYILLFVEVIARFRKKTFLVVLYIAALITASDQLSSTIVKNNVKRLRPCHVPELEGKVHLVKGECGGSFGFYSSHASNSSALILFLLFLFRKIKGSERSKRKMQILITMMIFYTALVSYSRIYLGTHYPGDIVAGIVFGSLLSFIFATIFFRIHKNYIPITN